jgi:hypothetical protein
MSYAIKPVPLPHRSDFKRVYDWLEELSRRGAELVTFMPTAESAMVLAIFRVQSAAIGDTLPDL